MKLKHLRYGLYGGIVMVMVVGAFLVVNPLIFPIGETDNGVDASAENLRKHVEYMTENPVERNHNNVERLNQVAEYIYNSFEESKCDEVEYQTYKVQENEYKNVICRFDGRKIQKIVIGAHYDSDGANYYEKNEEKVVLAGADDNASGTAGVLELARLIGMKKNQLPYDLELVAYTLEEMPHFGSETMGSYVHAKSMNDNNEDIKFMISLEMIGYFSEEKIQDYPIRALSRLYPSRGDFIALIGRLGDQKIRNLKKYMLSSSDIDVWSMSAPSLIQTVGFSDHRNYWNLGYRAYMITDTAFYRNKNYHTIRDTIDTLDFDKMKEVINGVYGIIVQEE